MRFLQAALQREDEARESYLHAHWRETLQVQCLRTSVRREISVESAQVYGITWQLIETENYPNFILSAEAIEKFGKSKLIW